MEYTWKDFDINEAVGGALVGVPSSINTVTEDIDDISKVAGRVTTTNVYRGYKVVINGKTAYLDDYGNILAQVPANSFGEATEMKIATATIEEEVGSTITRSGTDPGYGNQISLTQMEPRDHFAIQILGAMLANAANPESFDDASIMMFSRAAYRWAQGMMYVAANTRHGQSEAQSEDRIDINSNDMQSNSEKLLYNIAIALDKTGIAVRNAEDDQEKKIPFELDIKKVDGNEIHKGVPVIGSYTDNQGNTADPILLDIKKVDSKQIYQGLPIVGAGTTSGEVKPVLTKLDKDSEIKKILEITEMKKLTELTEVKKLAELTEIKKLSELTELKKLTEVTEIKAIPHVDIDSMPAVEIDGTPSVNVANSPTVTVSNMPSEPIEIEGTVSVDNFPTSE